MIKMGKCIVCGTAIYQKKPEESSSSLSKVSSSSSSSKKPVIIPAPKNQLYQWALPGQIIIDPKAKGRMAYNKDSIGDGIADPYFASGPGDPEQGLHEGMGKLLNRVKQTKAKTLYLHVVSTHGGDAIYGNHLDWNPFKVSIYPVQKYRGLHKLKMDRWAWFFTELKRLGVVVFLFLYDDSAKPWNNRNKVIADERKFIQDFIMEFRRFPNLVFCIGEEYAEAISKPRANVIGNVIRGSDPYRHVIGVHQNSGFNFNFPRNPHIKLFMMQQVNIGRTELHRKMVQTVKAAKGHFSCIMSEATHPGMKTWGTGRDARLKSWAAFMAGASGCLSYQRGKWNYPMSHVKDMNFLKEFAESVRELNYLSPNDGLRYGGSEYVLTNPNKKSCVLYSSTKKPYLGIKSISAGQYRLNWFNCKNGKRTTKVVTIPKKGNIGFKQPKEMGVESALWVRKL